MSDDDWDDELDQAEVLQELDDEMQELEDECGLLPAHLGGGCQLAGTEHCDFDCPFRDHPEWLIGEEDN